MKRNTPQQTVFLSFLFLLLFSCGQKLTDAAVQEEVTETLKEFQGADAVHAVVRDGIVFLTGQCRGQGCSMRLVTALEKLDGVQAVENDVTEGAKPGQ